MSNRYAMIDSTNTVLNICLWDGVTPFNPPGMTLVQSDTAQVGDTYADGVFSPGQPPPSDP
jgi:hypothetical protein